MNVLFLSQIVPYPPHGGVLQRGFNIIRELGRRATVHLLAFVHPDELRTSEMREESKRVLLEHCASVEYFPLWPKTSRVHLAGALAVSALSPAPFSVIAHRSRQYRRRIGEILRRGEVDVLHVDTLALGQFVADHSRVATVLTHHNIESTLMRRRAQAEKRHLAKAFLMRDSAKIAACERFETPRYDVNILMSPVDEALLKEQVPGARTAVVPNGVDVDYFTPGPDEGTRALIYTGGMNMFANRDAVTHFTERIWPHITAEVPDAQFFAVGQDPPPELIALSRQDSRIVVTGYVKDIRPLVRSAAVYVVPLRVGGGTRLKVLDAMSMGKAMVSTTIGCEGLDVNDGEHLTIADEPTAFAAAVVALLRDRDARIERGRSARQLVERRYAWPVIGDGLMAAYEQAMAHHRGRT